MCVPMDYAKKDHLVMFCNGHGDILRKLFSVKNSPEGVEYLVDQATPTKTCWTPTEKRGAAKVRGPEIPGGELGETPAGGREDRVAFW
jgi:hypothetical protein